MYQVTQLKNGLTIATAEMPHMASVSLGLWVGVGGRYEPAKVNGVCHFIEHMLFKGTRRRSAREISQAVEGIGGYLNAFTTEESTCFYSKARHDRFDDLLDVLTDMALNSVFDPQEIDKERNVIKEEVAMYLDQPQVQVQELLNELLWPEQPLGRPLTGTLKTLDVIGRPELVEYLRTNYVAADTIIAAAGNLKHKQVVKAAGRFAGRFSPGKRPVFAPAEHRQDKPRLRLFTKATEQTQLALAIRTCSRHDDRRYALRVLNVMLGENMSSRLFQTVREQYGLAYSIQSSLGFFDDVGVLNVSAGLETDNLEKALKLILKELRAFIAKPPNAAELKRARDYLIGQLDLGLEGTENQMTWMGEQWLGYGRILRPADIKRQIAEVKAADIRAVARDFFRSERLNLALVSPLKSAQKLAACLHL